MSKPEASKLTKSTASINPALPVALSDATMKCLEEGKQLRSSPFLKKIQHRLLELEIELQASRGEEPEGAVGAMSHTSHNLAHEVRILKEHCNCLSPIGRLPLEVLTKIFALLTSNAIDGWMMTRKHPIIPLTHVCRDWRASALQCPPLWSDLTYLTPRVMELAFNRSGNDPLEITFIAGKHRFTDVHRKALSQTGRLLSVGIEAKSKHALREYVSCFSRSAPILEDLSLKSGTELGRWTLPDGLLKGGTPSLKDLSLIRTGIPWSKIPVSSQLTHLTLNEWDMMTLGAETEAVLAFLKQTPLLQYLNLSSSLPYDALCYEPSDSSLIVTLPALQEMRLHELSSTLMEFLPFLRIPATTKVKLAFADDSEAFGVIDVEAIGMVLGTLKWIQGGSGAAGSRMVTKFHFSGWFLDEDDDDFEDEEVLYASFWFGEDPDPGLELTIARDESVNVDKLLAAFRWRLDFSSLHSFTLSDTGAPSSSKFAVSAFAWRIVFGQLPLLRTVELNRSWPTEFILATHPTLLEKLGVGSGFPALTTIVWEEIDWCEVVEESDEGELAGCALQAGFLVDFLADRPEPQVELHIRGCLGFSRKDFAQVQAIVPELKIQWDGFCD
ncbi:hypothetical protein D9611_010986 [Ephemerocybe angulata]|uniref:F-box domain-containing protein n=1 Tax=Ephemerocybe angulata TaxID=980116 RepID=A0A8H5BAU8_9AGAR|nr:hypothetical protein D9611_010986 [Tulosesus angulatus]